VKVVCYYDMDTGQQDSVTSSITGSFNTCYFSSPRQPMSPVTFNLPPPPATQPRLYPLSVLLDLSDVMLRDVTAQHDGQYQQPPAHDLDPITPLSFSGSRSWGDHAENVVFPEQRLTTEPTHHFQTPVRRRGLHLLLNYFVNELEHIGYRA